MGFLLFLLTFSWSFLLYAGPLEMIATYPTPSSSGEEKKEGDVGATLSLGFHMGEGVGYSSYSSAGCFLFSTVHRYLLPFLDSRLHVARSGRLSSTVGMGLRFVQPNHLRSFGSGIYYDFRSSPHLHTHQVAGVFEWLSPRLDIRLNGSLPVGGTQHTNPLTFAGFGEDQINVHRTTYYAYPAIDGEVGAPWTLRGRDGYCALGSYYLWGATILRIDIRRGGEGKRAFLGLFLTI